MRKNSVTFTENLILEINVAFYYAHKLKYRLFTAVTNCKNCSVDLTLRKIRPFGACRSVVYSLFSNRGKMDLKEERTTV